MVKLEIDEDSVLPLKTLCLASSCILWHSFILTLHGSRTFEYACAPTFVCVCVWVGVGRGESESERERD